MRMTSKVSSEPRGSIIPPLSKGDIEIERIKLFNDGFTALTPNGPLFKMGMKEPLFMIEFEEGLYYWVVYLEDLERDVIYQHREDYYFKTSLSCFRDLKKYERRMVNNQL